MALDPATQEKRIKAAAALAGMNLIEFGNALPKHGAGKSTARQILRTAGKTPPDFGWVAPLKHEKPPHQGRLT